MRTITTSWDKLGHFATKRDETWIRSKSADVQMGAFRDEKVGEKSYNDFEAACARYRANKEKVS